METVSPKLSQDDNKSYSAESVYRSLQSQMSNVDYTPWMRKKPKHDKSKPSSAIDDDSDYQPLPVIREHKCSSCCVHKRSETKKVVKTVENVKKIEWIQAQIQMYQTRCESFYKHEQDLIQDNLLMRKLIYENEKEGHDTVAGTIRRFDQYQKTLKVVETKQNEEKTELLKLVEDEKQKLFMELEMYENEVLKVDTILQDCQQLLKLLKTFKDSEYPEKELAVQKLIHEIEDVKLFNTEEIDELQRILERQHMKYIESVQEAEKKLKQRKASVAFSEMHSSWRKVALDNFLMKQQIKMQKQKNLDLENEQEFLRKLNQKLKLDERQDYRKQLFPHVFKPTIPICTPDMDIILDLPKREPCPV